MPIHLLEAGFKRSGKATKSLARLGPEALDLLIAEIADRLTEDNELHIRLDLLELIAGRIRVSKPGRRATVKGKTKFEVYPGDDNIVVARETLANARTEALRLGLPEDASLERQ
jgi:RNA binding exosome subunit